MKKIFLLIMVLTLGLVIVGCSDAKYSDDTVNIVFFTDANEGGSTIQPYLNLEPGELVEEPEEPTRTGFAFVGWFQDLQRTIPWDFDVNVVPEVSILLYAKWAPIVSIIIYDTNGGTMPNTNYPTEYNPGDRSVLPNPTRTGYQFIAWYLYDWDEELLNTKPGDRGYQTIPANSFGELYLYAHWRPIEVVVTFSVNFPGTVDKPNAPGNQYYKYGQEIDFPVLANAGGYRFLGWNSSSNGTGTWYVNGDLFTRTTRTTAYAIWEPIV